MRGFGDGFEAIVREMGWKVGGKMNRRVLEVPFKRIWSWLEVAGLAGALKRLGKTALARSHSIQGLSRKLAATARLLSFGKH